MDKSALKTVWFAVMLGVLIATSPSWLNRTPKDLPGYDAPWVYPSYNPEVQKQLSAVTHSNVVADLNN